MIQADIEGPVIVKMYPALGGADNAGVGETQFGERFVLKMNPSTCLAEFIGSAVCRASGIPTCEPCVVQFNGRAVFGSRLEAGLLPVPGDAFGLRELLDKCHNLAAFSAVLAIDIALGNPDRHWANWLYQVRSEENSVVMRSLDFSRAWPVLHPPPSFEGLRGENTHISWTIWPTLGIQFDQNAAMAVCDNMQKLGGDWLPHVFAPLPAEWKQVCDAPALCSWWRTEWLNRVGETKVFVQAGAWQ